MINNIMIQKKLEDVNKGIEQAKNLFQQLVGQKLLLEGMLNEDTNEKPKTEA